MKMIGIAHRTVLSLACSSRPDIPGMRTSAIRQAISESRPEVSKSSADSNEIAPNPEALSRRRSASRSKSSSSTTATRFVLLTLLISDKNLSPPSKNEIMISYSPVIYADPYSRGEQNFVPRGECCCGGTSFICLQRVSVFPPCCPIQGGNPPASYALRVPDGRR